MDDPDPTSFAAADVLEFAWPTVELDLALIAAVWVDPAEHLHQGRLPGAVLPADGMDLAVPDGEVDIAQRGHVAESLGDVPHFQQRSGARGCHASCAGV